METKVKLTKLAECAGCGAKVGAGELAQLFEGFPDMRDPNLLVGFDHADDAAVYRLADGLAIVQTLDFFPPIADDPFTFGQIAAANALSDIYAMGGRPITALNIMAVPEDMPKDAVREILRGGATKVAEAGAVVAGGHSIYDPEPKYGLSVTGVIDPARLLRNDAARPGDVLVYTKPVGIGIMTTALKGGLADDAARREVEGLMCTLNRAAAEAARGFEVHACTDITGFAVLGHCLELAQGSGTCVTLHVDAFRFLPGALDFAGGDVVHISSGVTGLLLCLALGGRRGFGLTSYRPHNVPFVALGAGLLWFGWFGFNGGSEFAADGTAARRSLADFAPPADYGFTSPVGLFAVCAGRGEPAAADYDGMIVQTVMNSLPSLRMDFASANSIVAPNEVACFSIASESA